MKKTLLGGLVAGMLCLALGAATLAAPAPSLSPSGLYAAEDGTLMMTDLLQRAVWQQGADGTVTRLAGRQGVADINGLPTGGYNDGAGADAAFQTPWAIAPYGGGWAITDTRNHAVRLLRDGTVTTLAGTGSSGATDGRGTDASFDGPTGLTALPDGSLLVADTGNNRLRRIDTAGVVSTYLGQEAGLLEPTGLCCDNGVVYVADSGNHRICTVRDGALAVLAGTVSEVGGYRDGPAALARFTSPQGVAARDGAVYVADTGNGAVRAIAGGIVTTLLGAGQGSGSMYPVSPRGLAFQGDQLAVADTFSRLVFFVPTRLPTTVFEDVSADDWYAQAVTTACGAGWMAGESSREFRPSAPLTREAAVTALYRLVGGVTATTAPIPFTDVAADAGYAPAAVWAHGAGIVPAEHGRLLPEKAVSRAELALWLHRCAEAHGETATAPNATLSEFSDGSSVPAASAEALRWAVGAQLLLGRADGRLDAGAAITRAEAAVVLTRYLDWAG